jgi:hypothetical protein
VLEYLEEARVAMDRARTQPVSVLTRQGLCVMGITCKPGKKSGEVSCRLIVIPPYQPHFPLADTLSLVNTLS